MSELVTIDLGGTHVRVAIAEVAVARRRLPAFCAVSMWIGNGTNLDRRGLIGAVAAIARVSGA